MLTKRDVDGYNMVEIEMILNYFPHSVWATEDDLKHLREQFYQPIIDRLTSALSKVDNRAFLSLFQGMTLTGPRTFTQNILNQFLNQYVKRIQGNEPMTAKEVFQFLEILI